MGDLFDFRDGEFELLGEDSGAVAADKYVNIDDSAHAGTETGSQPTGTGSQPTGTKHERGTRRKLSKHNVSR